MIPLYVPEYFKIQEFVDLKVYEDRGLLAWHLFDPQLLRDADMLRKLYGPMFINTWALSKEVQSTYDIRWQSGIRYPHMPEYKPYSQHSLGQAFDALFLKVTAAMIRSDIYNGKLVLDHSVILETGRPWLHWAVGNYEPEQTSGIIRVV